MLLPLLSIADPEVEAEGVLDPLGLEPLADRLADLVLPGLTGRMWRPRFLTAMVVCSTVTEPFRDQYASDATSPAHLVFEWYAVESYAQAFDGSKKYRKVPGIKVAQSALRRDIKMSARHYLKTPTVFGFHGVYKTLARALDIVDDDLVLGENGYRLLRTWEREQGLSGFSGGTGPGDSLRSGIAKAVSDGLKHGHTLDFRRWRFFIDNLSLSSPGAAERRLLWELLIRFNSETRGEVFEKMRRKDVRDAYFRLSLESEFHRWLSGKVSSELRYKLNAIGRYERVCRLLTNAFDRLRYVSTISGEKPVSARMYAEEAAREADGLVTAADRAARALDGTGQEGLFARLIAPFMGVRDAKGLCEALLLHHEETQRKKPPDGKRSWFERNNSGDVIVRPPYRLNTPPDEGAKYLHGYRTGCVASFVDDLKGGR